MSGELSRPLGRGRKIAFAIVSGGLGIGGFVPVLVDAATTGGLSWSLIPLGAVAMAWVILAPWFLLRARRALAGWAAATVAVPLYLWLLETLLPYKGWLLTLALPAAGLGLAAWGLLTFVWIASRLRAGFALAATLAIAAGLSAAEQALVQAYLLDDPAAWVRDLVTLCLAGAAVVVFAVALAVHRGRLIKPEKHG
jgi:hypothetical protein